MFLGIRHQLESALTLLAPIQTDMQFTAKQFDLKPGTQDNGDNETLETILCLEQMGQVKKDT